MTKVISVKFKENGRSYYFDPNGLDPDIGEKIIVETSNGLAFGFVSEAVSEVEEGKIVSELKKAVRIATDKDLKQLEENKKKEKDAFSICEKKIADHSLEMKLVEVEYSFDGSKITFFFTADGRVDFRELVKDLAAVFRMRIELRQIGVRDEAKMLGGVGNCGRGLCCSTWLSDFEPVSIKMAKVQNLSLNPSKISGICGRLMCCLKFENDVYTHMKKGMPSVGERIRTPDGMAVVTDVNILENIIKTRLVLEEASKSSDREEKLSTEFYNYKKEEIKRVSRKHNKKNDDDLGGLEGELLKEIKELMKD